MVWFFGPHCTFLAFCLHYNYEQTKRQPVILLHISIYWAQVKLGMSRYNCRMAFTTVCILSICKENAIRRKKSYA